MNSRFIKLITGFTLLSTVIANVVTVTPVHAAAVNVNDAASLIAAINNANSNNENDTITLTASIILTTVNNIDNGLPAILEDGGHSLTIEGNGFSITRSSAAGTPDFRFFAVNTTANLTLNNLTISNGYETNRGYAIGGAILNYGVLNINKSTFSNNRAESTGREAEGGAIYNNGTLTITDSTFSNNNTTSIDDYADGGAIINFGESMISNSTFIGNSGTITGRGYAHGGGIYNSGNMSVTNSTLVDNNSVTGGGGIFNSGNLTITNSTFFENASVYGGNIYNSIYNNANITIKNTIVATGIFLQENCHGTISAGADSLASDTSCGSSTPISYNNLKLGTLANNGGPTQTIALLSDSPAIDAGDDTICAAAVGAPTYGAGGKDQRGVTRPQGAGCDVGAFEFGIITIPIVIATNPSANAVLTSLSSITVVFNQDMLDNATANGAENVNNYILVERGANAAFDTASCAGGVVSDDAQQTISTANYNSAGFITTLTLASPLTAGTYRLFVCGTTSVWSVAGIELNNGASDHIVDFTITATGTSSPNNPVESTRASLLPKTGFAPNKITTLPAQPADLAYAELGDLWLEIPALNLKSTIVGVPQNKDKTWDVSWLGNDTGWLNGTAFPTWNGNSVLTAHVTNASGLDGPFAALKSLKYGDQVIVHFGSVKYVYEIRDSRLSRPYSTNYAFQSMQDHSYLTLITCSGYNPVNESYLFRRVVRAVLVSAISE